MNKNNNKGFTLVELMIVIAIIGVLTSILLPTFTEQIEKAKEAKDMANIRTAMALVQSAYLTGEDVLNPKPLNGLYKESGKYTMLVEISQEVDGWAMKNNNKLALIGGALVSSEGMIGNNYYRVSINNSGIFTVEPIYYFEW